VVTVGGLRDGSSGFRAYRAADAEWVGGDQLVAVWDRAGALRCVVVGEELGARRTGALGAVAADALARPDARVAAVIGSGRQAWTQLWALAAVRPLDDVRVFSRSPESRAAFAERAEADLGVVRARAVDSAAEAVRGADMIVLATRSATPVILAEDVGEGTHVITVGPKTRDAHELPLGLVERASVVTCDAPEQARGDGSEFVTGSRELTHLGAVLSGEAPGRGTPEELTLHCSVGLAGSEVLFAERLWRAQAT
jgi:ornithine cyclodeaminase/alanine dehydrogenase-like protein (mu-crystallin family)